MSKKLASPEAYQDLLQEIGQALHSARQHAAQTVNTEAVAQQALARDGKEAVGERIARAIHAARSDAVARRLPALAEAGDNGGA